jgi:hypothetical protein
MIFEIIQPATKEGRWTRPQATMNVKGELKISRVAFEMLGEPERVLVSFDKGSQTIALRKATRHDTKTHKLIAHGRHGEHGGRLIRVHGLLEHIDADLYTCMRFRDVRLDNNERLLLEVANAVPAYHGKRIGVYNEWRMRHDGAYATAQREAYARRKAAKAAAEPTEEEKEEKLAREDRAIREREYRAARKAEKAERREHEMAARAAERAKARERVAETAPPGMVEIDLGNGQTMLVTKQRAREIDQARLDYDLRNPLDAYKAKQQNTD